MKHHVKIFVSMLIAALVFGGAGCIHAKEQIVWAEPLESVALTAAQVEELSTEALLGSPEAAHKISVHYLMATNNGERQMYWTRVAAENGSAHGQFNYADLLLAGDSLEEHARARFWLARSADQGNESAKKRLAKLESQDKSEDTHPTDNP